jgi:hypothetical protein
MFRKLGVILIVAIIAVPFLLNSRNQVQAATCGTTNIALNQPATSSSNEAPGTLASYAVDGNLGSRWSSAFSDPQWLQVDLGSTQSVCRVTINWETAYGKSYQIQVSNDATNWTTIYSTTAGAGGTEDLTGLSGSGRYIRMYGTARATAYGYSIWEFLVYAGTSSPTNTATATNSPTATKTNTPVTSGCGTTNIALNKTATSSSNENAGTTPNLAVDGNTGTRWSSAFSDPQWLQVDLGSTQSVCKVILRWETAYGKSYQIQTSNDATNWTTIYSTTTGAGGVETLNVSGSGRYIRMYGTVRATGYGYSLWEFEVYSGSSSATATNTATFVPPTYTATATSTGTSTATKTATATGTATATPSKSPTVQTGPVDFGPNVIIFDTSMSSATIQGQLNSVFTTQQSNQFGNERYALLFKPGSYAVDANIGFYTQISGLGLSPNDVSINHVYADAQWFNGNATQNFWRIAENMHVLAPDGINTWAVSQAAPFRRMNVNGELKLDPSGDGWSSGGFLADTIVSGQAFSGSQQQYFTRNSQIGSWSNCVWNCVFVGVGGAPGQSFPNPTYTTVGSAPTIAEKPFLYVDSSGNYNVFVPALRANTSGTSWNNGTAAGSSLPINQFYIVKAGATSTDINNALAAGLNLIVTPGVYNLDQTINVTRANTVILGLGLATFINNNGVVAINVADVDGVRIAGLLFDAGTTNAPALIQVGPSGASASHAANPIILYDVFIRVGGVVAGKVTNAVVVNSNDVIIDDTWIWRADHGTGVGWTANTANSGLIVNGANATLYGLFVEHFQQYNVIFNGNGAKVYFFQNELPYDPPNQAAYMNGSTHGYAAYKVADSVTTHEGWGLGSYCYFNVDPTIVNDHSFEAPNTANVKFHDLLTVSLGNNGAIVHVINNTGAQTPTNTTPSTVVSYP